MGRRAHVMNRRKFKIIYIINQESYCPAVLMYEGPKMVANDIL